MAALAKTERKAYMIRTVFRISLVLLSSGIVLPQDPHAVTMSEITSATLSGMQGLREAMESPGEGISVAPGSMSAAGRPASTRHSAGMVSVKQLRHRPPKAAAKAYQKAAQAAWKKDFQDATKELERAIALDAEFAEAHCDLGVAYARLGRYREAEAELRRAIELIPEESVPRYNLALLLFAIGQRAEAEVNARQALRLFPENAKAHMLIGGMLVESEETVAEGLWHLRYAARTLPEANRMVEALHAK